MLNAHFITHSLLGTLCIHSNVMMSVIEIYPAIAIETNIGNNIRKSIFCKNKHKKEKIVNQAQHKQAHPFRRTPNDVLGLPTQALYSSVAPQKVRQVIMSSCHMTPGVALDCVGATTVHDRFARCETKKTK